ncbi:hypothetical protein SUDANB121_04872 [Nocardiopsis dassonvillei]|uniref:hypothetical protein n=1 Tax=Nocardiopsis dassonvillei TaxID=2014 RepID=UPI003F54D942
MSTSENTTPTDDTTPDGTAAEEAGAASPPAAETADAFLEGGRGAGTPGVLSAETFALASLLLLTPVATGQRLFELFGRFAFTDVALDTEGHLAAVNADLLAYGGLSVLTVLAASLSLFLGRAATRAWARWLASATVLAGGVFVVLSIVTYAVAAGRI